MSDEIMESIYDVIDAAGSKDELIYGLKEISATLKEASESSND